MCFGLTDDNVVNLGGGLNSFGVPGVIVLECLKKILDCV